MTGSAKIVLVEDEAFCFLADQLRNIWISTLTVLNLGFDCAQLIYVLDETLWTAITADDAFPARLNWNLAPISARSPR